MRYVFLFLLLLGIGAAAFPFLADRFDAREVGTWPAYRPASGFRAISLPLTAGDAPLRIFLDLSAPAPFTPDQAASSATITIAREGRTILAEPVSFRDAVMRDDNPQTPERTFRAEAGVVDRIEDGTYTVTVARGEAEIPQVAGFDVVVARRAAVDPRLQPAGFTLIALGFVGFMLTFRGRGSTAAPVPQKARWGRDAAPRE